MKKSEWKARAKAAEADVEYYATRYEEMEKGATEIWLILSETEALRLPEAVKERLGIELAELEETRRQRNALREECERLRKDSDECWAITGTSEAYRLPEAVSQLKAEGERLRTNWEVAERERKANEDAMREAVRGRDAMQRERDMWRADALLRIDERDIVMGEATAERKRADDAERTVRELRAELDVARANARDFCSMHNAYVADRIARVQELERERDAALAAANLAHESLDEWKRNCANALNERDAGRAELAALRTPAPVADGVPERVWVNVYDQALAIYRTAASATKNAGSDPRIAIPYIPEARAQDVPRCETCKHWDGKHWNTSGGSPGTRYCERIGYHQEPCDYCSRHEVTP